MLDGALDTRLQPTILPYMAESDAYRNEPVYEACAAFAKHLEACPRKIHVHVLSGADDRAAALTDALKKAGWEENSSPREHILVIVGQNVQDAEAEKLRSRYQPCALAVWGAPANKVALCYLASPADVPLTAIMAALDVLRSEAALIKSLSEEHARTDETLAYLEQLIKTRDEFFSIATHDLRSPLTTLKLSLSMLKAGPDAQEILGIMQRNIARMEALVNDMLEVFRLYRGTFALNLADTDVNRLVEDNIVSFYPNAIEKGITVDFILDRAARPVKADQFRVSQVVANLISNALKYTPKTGVVEVSTTWEKDGIRISVKDNGPGIPPQERDRLFKSFGKGSAAATGGEQSTGLGLYICKRIMDMHRGRIWFDSEPGKGTTFHAFFPADPALVPQPEKNAFPKPAS
jgi:signal transduction histidine kinase